jgi:hypothetical protein
MQRRGRKKTNVNLVRSNPNDRLCFAHDYIVVSARIWLCLYWFDHQMSLGTGRPIVLRDEHTIKHCRILLTHPMASLTDLRLVSQVELIAQKSACPVRCINKQKSY